MAWVILTLYLYACASTTTNSDVTSPEKFDIEDTMRVGNAHYTSGELQEAAKAYDAVLNQNPDYVEAHYKLGVIKYKQGLIDQSRTHFLMVLTSAPTYSKAYYNLGTIYATLGPTYNAEKATFFFNKYLTLEPDSSHRSKIEQWMAKYGKPQKTDQTFQPSKTSPGSPESQTETGKTDLKNWLKQQAEQISTTE